MPGIHNTIRFQNGDSVGFEDFFKENYAIFSSFAYRYIPDRDLCEDLVQEVFLSFWEKKDSFGNKVSARSFFYTSIRNACLNKIKHDKVKLKYLNYKWPGHETSDSFLEAIFKKEAYREIYREVNKLPEMAQKVLKLTLRGKSNDEIATLLGIAVNTVKVHKNRTYRILRKNLHDLYYIFLFFRKPVPA
jgi:RNA polymerase sigma-70 factor (ECF subfamily)